MCLESIEAIRDENYLKLVETSGLKMPSGNVQQIIIRKIFEEQDINKIRLQRVCPVCLYEYLETDAEENMTMFSGINEETITK